MCGIVGGMSTTLNQGELSKIKGLMIMSCFRGMYGSGSMVVSANKKHLNIATHKTELCAAELMCDEDFIKQISHSPKIVVTHARAPTKGDNSLANVHPHRSKHITGVHNGTMHRIMDKTVGNDESDSAAVFAALAEHGVEQFVKESRGAYSLVWLDAKAGTLNFLRNDMRPMVFASIGWNGNCSTMYFASELGQLKYVLSRDGVKLDDVKFESPKPWQHVVFPMDVRHNIQPLELKQFEDPIKFVPSTSGYGGMYSGWEQEIMDCDAVDAVTKRIDDSLERRRAAAGTAYRHNNNNSTGTRLPAVINVTPGGNVGGVHTLPSVTQILSRRDAPSAHFRESNDPGTSQLLRQGACCICDDTPAVTTREGTTVYPRVHKINFGTGFPQYICDACVQGGNPIALSILGDTEKVTRH